MDSMLRVIVADDHPVVRAGLRSIISTQPDMELVAEAANGRELIQAFRQHLPHVAAVDLDMPELGGLEAMSAIRSQFQRLGSSCSAC